MQFTLATASLLASMASGVFATTGKLGDAAVISNNPTGASYEAQFDGKVKGSIVFTTHPGGKGVDVAVSLNGFAGEPGPFGYHIHDQPVPADGNCTGTLAHLDPYERGQDPECDKTAPATCQVGDLSGKHKKIPGENSTDTPAQSFADQYTDLYISTLEGIGAFLGNRSVVIHRGDFAKSRLICANITAITPSSTGSGSASPSGTAGAGSSAGNSTNGTQPTSPAAPPTQTNPTGAASSFGVSAIVSIAAIALGMAMAF